MPTECFIETTEEAQNIVDNTDIDNVSIYINTPLANTESDDPNRCAMPQCMKPSFPDDKNLRIYHILSYAVDTGNIVIIKHVMDNFEYDVKYTPHGHAYDLIILAIENWIRNVKREERENTNSKPETFYKQYILEQENELTQNSSSHCYDVILTLLKYNFAMSYGLRLLINYCDRTDDYKLVDLMIRKYNCDIWDMYHYSIFWCYPKVFDYAVEHYSDLIDFNITKNSVKMIETHGSKDKNMQQHVYKKLDEMGIKY